MPRDQLELREDCSTAHPQEDLGPLPKCPGAQLGNPHTYHAPGRALPFQIRRMDFLVWGQECWAGPQGRTERGRQNRELCPLQQGPQDPAWRQPGHCSPSPGHSR